MTQYYNSSEEPQILHAIKDVLTGLRGSLPLNEARKSLFSPGFLFTSSNSSSITEADLEESVRMVERCMNESTYRSGGFILKPDFAPEIFVYNSSTAAVWAPAQAVFDNGSVVFQSWISWFLVKEGNAWKVSGMTHSRYNEEEQLPEVQTERPDEADRLVHFIEIMAKNKEMLNLDDWATEKTREVSIYPPAEPVGRFISEVMKDFADKVAGLPEDAPFKEKTEDVVVRIAGDVGFVLVKFTTYLGDSPERNGVSLLSIHKKDGVWKFGGIQRYSVAI